MHITTNQITAGLTQAQQRNTAQTLGNRSQYIGASDISHCPRKTVLAKTNPKTPDLATLIRFERGHLAEEIIAGALQAYQPDRQVELEADIPYCPHCRCWSSQPASGPMYCPDCGEPLRLLPLKAHCDFVFDGDLIVECKSAQNTEIHDGWKTQLQTQMLLYEHCTGRSPQGYILVIDLGRGHINIAGPYVSDPVLVPEIIQRGIKIWEGVVEASSSPDPESADYKTEPGPLCGWCDYLTTCPAFQGEVLPAELEGLFRNYLDLCRTEKAAKAEKDILRDQALAILKPGRYKAEDLRVSLFERSRTTTDMKALSALLKELGQDINTYQKQSTYKVLDVKAA